jgi:two-component system, NarL family, response regulator LiaR
MNRNIRVLVVDDHRLVRKGVISLLQTASEIEVVGEAENGELAVAEAIALQPDVVLLDLSMPVADGLTAIPALKKLKPAPSILVLTSFSEDERVFAAVRAGALGYVLKDCSPEQLVEAIKSVSRGQPSLSSDVAQKLVRQVHRSSTPSIRPIEPLSDRELEVLKLVAAGLSNSDIAERLAISERTVGAHISRILDKLGVANRTQAALYAMREGLVMSSPTQ